MPRAQDIREVLLDVIAKQSQGQGANLQTVSVLRGAAEHLKFSHNNEKEQALLTQFSELFRTGYLAWGLNISNPNPPFFHLTEQGRRTLERLSRDPGNPEGYLRHVHSIATLNPIAKSYLEEAVQCYVGALYKASAVMVGAATESIVIHLRDKVDDKLTTLTISTPTKLARTEWRIKTILDGLKFFFDSRKNSFPGNLKDEFEGNWPAFTQQIRAARNEAGHPSNVDSISPETVHASLLIFPEVLKLAHSLGAWVEEMV